MSSNTNVSPIRGSGINIPLPYIAATILATAGMAALLIGAQSLGVALAVVSAAIACAFLIRAPLFWLAGLLVLLIPFQALITQALGGFGSNARQLFAVWKEVLLLVGIFRLLYNNPNRNEVLRTNRWVLICSGVLIAVYVVTFFRTPSMPAIFSLDLEMRFLAMMLFFMLLRLDGRHAAILVRLMLWSVGLLAVYGLIQYFWDYERLLPLVYNLPDLLADGHRRLYSYSLSALEAAYAAMIAILILFSGATRSTLRVALWWTAILVPCLLLTYTRSAYLGLIVGVGVLCILKRPPLKHILGVGVIASCCVCGVVQFYGNVTSKSSLGQRLESIFSQDDQSSLAHKERMQSAVRVVAADPLGIGLGKYGTVQARFSGGVSEAAYTENWILEVAVETGVIGAFAYVALTAAVLVSLVLRIRGKIACPKMLTAAIAVFVAMTIAGIMIPVWDTLLPTVYTWALVGMALNPSLTNSLSHSAKGLRRSGL